MAEYGDFIKSTGYGDVAGLCGANCRHSFGVYIEGVSPETYSDADLDKFANETVTYTDPNYICEQNPHAVVMLTKLFVHSHYEEICTIFATLHKISPDEVKGWKRSEANAQITEMMSDGDLQSFFMSSDTLAQGVSSAI